MRLTITSRVIAPVKETRVLDRNTAGRNCGCPELQRRMLDLHPCIHCLGHIHANAGMVVLNGTCYVNASMVNSRFEIIRGPIELDI
jgi:Icc-related predicted phosphoesterase